MTMAPEILVAMTPDLQERAPEPLIFRDLVDELRFDPWEPWYPCGCPHRLDDIHVDDCWLDWLALPMWMQEDTTEVPVVLDVPYTEIEKRVANSGVARSVPGAGGWCAPADTLSWCGHALSAGCGCEFAPVPIGEIVIDLSKREVSEVDDDTVLLGVVEPLDEDETTYFERHHDEPTSDVDDERSDDGDVRGEADEGAVDDGDGRSGE